MAPRLGFPIKIKEDCPAKYRREIKEESERLSKEFIVGI
jgi:hypothetical protein